MTRKPKSSDPMDPEVRQISSQVVYQNRWMTVREDGIQRSDGSEGIYGLVDKPDFAVVIPASREGFHLVEQYRYPLEVRSWEFPQGAFPDRQDGDPEVLARAELGEETGLRAGRLEHLGRLHAAPGMTGQGFNVFLATDLADGEQARREPEEQGMLQRWVSRPDFEAMIRDGRIIDAATVAAYALLLLRAPDTG